MAHNACKQSRHIISISFVKGSEGKSRPWRHTSPRSSPNRPNCCCWRSASRLRDKISAPHPLPCTLHRLRHAAARGAACCRRRSTSLSGRCRRLHRLLSHGVLQAGHLLAKLSSRSTFWSHVGKLLQPGHLRAQLSGRMRASCRWSKAAAPPNRGSRSSACCLCIEISPSSQDISVWTVLALAMSFNIAH